jgi:heterodisulfide reductase subunit C
MATHQHVPATSLELRFIGWLLERSKDVKWAYERWLETPSGECYEGVYCTACAGIQRYVERHNRTGFTRVGGWDDDESSDQPYHCERCDTLLHHCPTEHMIEEETEWLSRAESLSDDDAAILHNLMTCGGEYEYDRGKWWLLVEPHVVRLVEAADNTKGINGCKRP